MTSMSYWYEQLTKIKGNEQIIPMAQKLEIKINGNVLWRDFLDSNDLSVEDFWIVLYFQTLPYDGFIRIFRHSSALWRLISMTCSLVSRDIFEHGFHGWFFDFLNTWSRSLNQMFRDLVEKKFECRSSNTLP
ncbi:uncharacterized protein OCT59_010583 [Rhizophagus irregularis]|uniref:uncharacterized protein n=1 Tax=Rhizophagus irregularis TaxID=588596 RepID=UPI00331C2D1C|nr:hypothetical protein OCT59_028968 [Rhizophagus irregularis]UZO19286.1 hypothetical protein OCT59_010583 [Rhizophagus irregularis]